MRTARLATAVSATILTLVAGPAASQVPSGVGEGWLGEFEHASRQLLQLAEAIPGEKFTWRPAAGVRSMSEVYMHLALGNQFLLKQAGGTPSLDLAKVTRDTEKQVTDKAEVIKYLKESFEAVRTGYRAADHQKKVQLFKKDVTTSDVFLRILVHNHEHMGQAVAYARMNGIAPPWSGGQ